MAIYRVNAFAAKHADKGISPGGLRWEIFNAEKNGLSASGAISREGRKVYVDEDRYFGWKSGQRGAA
jgi:hypothetical protein